MVCSRIFVLLELLNSMLSYLKIGSDGGIQLVSSCNCFLFISPIFRNAAGKSVRDRSGPRSPRLFKLLSTPFRTFLVLAERQHTCALVVQVRPSVCKTLPSIRRSSATFDRFHSLVRFFLVANCALGSTMTSTSVPNLLDGDVRIVKTSYLFLFHFRVASVGIREVPQS